jgi:TRAP-type mannitol/chloroaromatic compound transport system permease small subunit
MPGLRPPGRGMTSETSPAAEAHPSAAPAAPAPDPDRFDRVVLGIARRIDLVADWSGHIFCWLTLVLVGAVVIEVISRYAFGAPTLWAYDVTWMTYGAMFMLGGAYTLYRQGHIRTDFIYNMWPPRWQGLIDATLHLFVFFPALFFFLVAAYESAGRSWALGERSYQSPWQPPVYPLKIIIAVSIAMLMLQGVSELLKSVYAVVRGRWP